MPPKGTKAKPKTRDGPLGKVDANAVKKPAAKANAKGSKSPGTKPSPKSQTKTSTSIPAGDGAESSSAAKQSAQRAPNEAPSKSQAKSVNKSDKSTKSTGKASSSKVQAKKKPVNPNLKRYQESPKYLFLCRLRGTENPTISRILSVPSIFKFAQLHDVLQISFGWANCHMHRFNINEVDQNPDEDLEEDDDSMWKSPKFILGLSPDADLDRQTMGEFGDFKDTREVSLADIFEDEKYANGKTELVYEYDMGDGWEHDIVFLGLENSGTRTLMSIPSFCPVICLNGEGHPCAEDAGGIPGWEDLKELFAHPRQRDVDDKKAWYKTICANGDPKGLDPYKWDIFKVNYELSELVKK